ncbi:unnamed protein product [Porites lobata]|uniref:HIRAN domain-containing protein n=1 Tax=Porites lobata TaxID=104759 RepID=A0ABN8NX67_9CNID|nr:unnamed protein product [Porites lobata]
MPLTPWGQTPDKEAFLNPCGILLSNEYAVNLAVGNVDPRESTTIRNTFALPIKKGLWQPRDLALTVSSLGQDNIEWTIPSFPVLTIEFVKGTVSITGRRTGWPALFQADDSGRTKCGDEIIAQKWCNIVVENITYLVIWEFRRSEPVEPEDHSIVNADDSDDSNEENDSSEIEHTVPFKVLGTAYKGRQIILKNAYECLENNKKDVQAQLQPEPENDYDQNAIAVLINCGSGWNKVGYIAKELTSDIHPIIERNNIKVTVARIRFRVNYLLVGFYVTLNITKKGP